MDIEQLDNRMLLGGSDTQHFSDLAVMTVGICSAKQTLDLASIFIPDGFNITTFTNDITEIQHLLEQGLQPPRFFTDQEYSYIFEKKHLQEIKLEIQENTEHSCSFPLIPRDIPTYCNCFSSEFHKIPEQIHYSPPTNTDAIEFGLFFKNQGLSIIYQLTIKGLKLGLLWTMESKTAAIIAHSIKEPHRHSLSITSMSLATSLAALPWIFGAISKLDEIIKLKFQEMNSQEYSHHLSEAAQTITT